MAMFLKTMSSLCFLFLVLQQVSSSDYTGPFSHSNIRLDEEVRRFRRQTDQQIKNETIRDNHVYYTSKFYPANSAEASRLWFDVSQQSDAAVIQDHGISSKFRVYNVMQLPFDFLFYGHTIDKVALTTAGFLYTSDYLHSRIYLTQYIAPLQADFNPSLNDSARILIYNHTERFTVQWDSVHVTNHVENGTFTFQVSLFPNGTIHFAYREIPLLVSEITEEAHPVRVGLADSFYVDRPLRANLILRQVYEYSSIDLDTEDLAYSAFVLDPVPSCVPANTCMSCEEASKVSPFQCRWCGTLNRCSDGVDRFRQEWVTSGCSQSSTTSCLVSTGLVSTGKAPQTSDSLNTGKNIGLRIGPNTTSIAVIAGISVLAVLVAVAIIVLVATVVGILCYGYRRPTSKVGLFLIEHRPKARSLNKTKGKYDVDSGKVILDD